MMLFLIGQIKNNFQKPNKLVQYFKEANSMHNCTQVQKHSDPKADYQQTKLLKPKFKAFVQIRTHTDTYRHKKSHKHVVSSMGQEYIPQKDHLSSNFTDTIKHTTPLVQSH